MKCIVFVVTLFGLVRGDITKDEDEYKEIFKEIGNAIKNVTLEDKKTVDALKSICSGVEEHHIYDVAEDIAACFGKLNFNKTVCTLLQTSIPKCLDPLVDLFTNCLKGEGKSLPKFIVELGKATSHFQCTSSGETVTELYLNLCFTEDSEALHKLINDLKERVEKYKGSGELPSKAHICSILKDVKEDFLKHVESVCFNSVTQAAYRGIYNELLGTCEDTTAAADNKID